jgi:monovalent cation/proton antiporter MnhG/PhaG subunit
VIVQDIVADLLLAFSVTIVLGSSLGLLVMRDVYQKLHFVTPAVLVAPVLVALAVVVEKGYSENTTETWLALFFVVLAGPFLAHATIRAARVREVGDWRPGRGRGPADEPEAR